MKHVKLEDLTQSAPTSIPSFRRLPENAAIRHLASHASWVSWRYHTRATSVPEGAAPAPPQITKPPVDPKTGDLAKVSQPSTWGTYDEAVRHSTQNNLPGVGVVLTEALGLIAYDLDHCISDDGEPEPWVKAILELRETYAERSPSGRGIRILALGSLDKAIVVHAAGVEAYSSGRYVTITGDHIEGTPDKISVAPRTSLVLRERARSIASKSREAALRTSTQKRGGRVAGQGFYRNVNDAAMRNLDLWVPELLPFCVGAASGYRVSSADLDRDLQEDLAIYPTGIVDFGVADMGDDKEGRRTPIDLVIEYGSESGLLLEPASITEQSAANAKNAKAAALWLCEQMNVKPWDLGLEPRTEDEWLERVNDEYCVVSDRGRTSVIQFSSGLYEKQTRELLIDWSFQSFRDFHCNRFVSVSCINANGKEDQKSVPVGRWWLEHPDRRQYDGITFRPGQAHEVDGELNIWRGFGACPRPGDWSLMQRHISEVLAGGNEEVAAYIIKWCAWAVQNPDLPAEVALVFRGAQGTGKGTLCNTMRRLFGQHGLQIASSEQFSGRFNGHFRDVVLLFADESYWPGNKGLAGNLKRMITEPTIFIEAKGKDGISVPNYLKIMVASNESWVVPAAENERRFSMHDVSDIHMQDQSWFLPLHNQLENGGMEAMLHDLLRQDLTGFHPRDMPITKALLNQQEVGLDAVDAWWKQILDEGMIPGALQEHPNRSYSSAILSHMQQFSYDLKNWNEHKLGHYLRSVGANNDSRIDNKRYWTFPSLKEARARWEKKFKGTSWGEPHPAEWQVMPGTFGNAAMLNFS